MDNFDALLEMVGNSAVAILIYPGPDSKIDMKFSVELGVAVALGKPMILAVRPGTRVSDKLVSICDRIVEVDLSDPKGSGEGLLAMLRELVPGATA